MRRLRWLASSARWQCMATVRSTSFAVHHPPRSLHDRYDPDETLARYKDVAVLSRRVITTLAAHTRTPDVRLIIQSVAEALPRFGPMEARAHQQNAAGNVAAFFTHLLPPAEWAFHGHTHHLGIGQMELLWKHADGRVLLDELHTGRPALLNTTVVHDRALELLAHGRHVFAAQLAGVRLLCTSNPRSSLLFSPIAPTAALHTTAYVRPRSAL